MKRLDHLVAGAVPSRGVVDPKFVDALLQLQDLRTQTQDWIAAQKDACAKECAAALADAKKAGRDQGRAEYASAVAAYVDARSALSTEIEDILRSCLGAVLGACPDHEILRASVASALHSGASDADLTIHVAQNDLVAMTEIVAKLEPAQLASAHIDVMPDPSVPQGSCTIFTQTDVLTINRDILCDQLLSALSVEDVWEKLRNASNPDLLGQDT